MSHLLPPQEEKKVTATSASQWNGKLPVDHEVPPQYQQSTVSDRLAAEDPDYLVPPQEEKRTVFSGQAAFDKGMERLDKELEAHAVQDDATSRDERIRNKQIASSVLSGSAGVTGEDLGVAENRRWV